MELKIFHSNKCNKMVLVFVFFLGKILENIKKNKQKLEIFFPKVFVGNKKNIACHIETFIFEPSPSLKKKNCNTKESYSIIIVK